MGRKSSKTIVITTMLWRRHAIFRLWANCMKKLIPIAKKKGFDLIISVAGSEGDQSRELVESFGFEYQEVENEPIGRKANERLNACKQFNPDFVILCGSDDIISPKTFRYYLKKAKQGFDEVCIMDLYYYNILTGELAYSEGYIDHRLGEPIAPWRMLSRKACDLIDWCGWNNMEYKYLDGWIYKKLKAIPIKRHYFRLKDIKALILDVKSNMNMTSFVWRPNWHECDYKILNQLNKSICAELQQL